MCRVWISKVTSSIRNTDCIERWRPHLWSMIILYKTIQLIS